MGLMLGLQWGFGRERRLGFHLGKQKDSCSGRQRDVHLGRLRDFH